MMNLKLTGFILLLLTCFLSQAQVNIGTWAPPNIASYKVTTLQEAINRQAQIGCHISVAQPGVGGDFVVLSKAALAMDGAVFIDKGDGTCLYRENSQTMSIKAEWFGFIGDGVTDNYTQAQALATYINNRHGHAELSYASLWYSKPVYKINQIKYQKTTGSDTATNNGIVDITFNKDTNLHIYGGGAKFDIKGDFYRKATVKAGNFWHSAYQTVCPFVINDCAQVVIDNMELYGEVDKMSRDSLVVEGQCYGIKIQSSTYVELNNIYTHHFATDGTFVDASSSVYAGGHRLNCQNIVFTKVRCEYNARQGMTMGSINNFTAINCSFSHTGDSMGTYIHHGPSAGIDIEPVLGPPTTDYYTRNIHFTNCTFENNFGAAFTTSLSVVQHVYLDRCYFDNRKFNNQFALIAGILDFNMTNSTFYTGKGSIYPGWGNGKGQRSYFGHNTIISNSTGITITGFTPEFGCTFERNYIIGQHDTGFTSFFPFISSVIIFKENTIMFDSGMYNPAGPNRGSLQFLQLSQNNTYKSNLDTTGGKFFTINFTSTRTIIGDNLPANGAVKVFDAQGWNPSIPYTRGVTSAGDTISMEGGGRRKTISFGNGAPADSRYYEKGSMIFMNDPIAASTTYYQCTVSGIAGADAVFAPGPAVGASGRGTSFKYGLYQDLNGGVSAGDSSAYLGQLPRLISRTTNGKGSIYSTANTINDTGMVLFKSPVAFSNATHMSVKGTIVNNGRMADFEITFTPTVINTFTQASMDITGDAALKTTKVRLLKDASNAYYIGFFDTSSLLIDKTTITIDAVHMAGVGATMYNAGATWTASLVNSLSGYTIGATLNNAAMGFTSLTTNNTSGASTYDALTGILNIPQYTGGGGGGTNFNIGDSAILKNPAQVQTASFNIAKTGGGNNISNLLNPSPTFAPPSTALAVAVSNVNFNNVGLSFGISGGTSGMNFSTTTNNFGSISVGGYQATPGLYRAQETVMSALEQVGGVFNFLGKAGLTAGTNYTLDKWLIVNANGISNNGVNPTAGINLKANSTTTANIQFDLTGAAAKTGKVRGGLEAVNNVLLYTDSTLTRDTLTTQRWARANLAAITSFTESDPVYQSNGVSLNTNQSLTGVKTFPASTGATPSIVINTSSTNYTGTTAGAVWAFNNHLWGFVGGAAVQLDNSSSTGVETDPVYSSNGVTLNTVQTLTAYKQFPASTASNPSLVVIPSVTNYTGATNGAVWAFNNHLWGLLGGAAVQLDNSSSTGVETDPVYTANGVTLNTAQSLTGVKTFPASTGTTPSFVVTPSSTSYVGATAGAVWAFNNHIWALVGGSTVQLDNSSSTGVETDPVYTANGVTLNTVQTLTAYKQFPASTGTTPSAVFANSASNYTGTTAGAVWVFNNHIYAYLGGAATQLDGQGGGSGGGGGTDTICNSIYNDVVLQTGANFNIDGLGRMGALAFNTTPTLLGAGGNDDILTVDIASGAVHRRSGQLSFTLTVTGNTTLNNVVDQKMVVLVNSGSPATIVLPSASANIEKDITVKTITANSVTMSGVFGSDPNTIAGNSFGALNYHSNGSIWYCTFKL